MSGSSTMYREEEMSKKMISNPSDRLVNHLVIRVVLTCTETVVKQYFDRITRMKDSFSSESTLSKIVFYDQEHVCGKICYPIGFL